MHTKRSTKLLVYIEDNTLKWYVINVYAGSEKKVAETIPEMAAKRGLSDFFGEMLVPTEKVVEIRRGEKVQVDKKFLPGYIIAQMDLNDDTWHFICSIPKVSGFLGNRGKPVPISHAEVSRLLQKTQDSEERARRAVHFDIGDSVKVCDGPFSSFTGVIEEVEDDKDRLKVAVFIFGRATNVSLNYSQVEKV